jgi:hypothetical protein
VDIISRDTARAAGQKRYFTGKPCKYGHVGQRFVGGGACCTCHAVRCDLRDSHTERLRKRKYQAKNRDQVNAANRLWRAKNPAKQKAAQRAWEAVNKGRRAALVRHRQALKLKATPPWLTPEDRAAMRFLYEEALGMTEHFGVHFEVDHIVPLRGKTVCGLHVPWNLQVVSRTANRSKGHAVPTEQDDLVATW